MKLTLAGLFLLLISQSADKSLPQMRLTPAEIRALDVNDEQAERAGVASGRPKILFGDPQEAGFYCILVFVPPHTTIQAHSHRDNRMATVLSGEWHFGYGDRFDASALKTLPPGSVYSEPGGTTHFAQSGAEPVIVQISGFGPTDTKYFDPANDPGAQRR